MNRKSYYLILLLTIPCFLMAQNARLIIGKRKNIIWDRKIDSKNLGNIYTYYYPIYYKFSGGPFKKTGILGGRIDQVLQIDPNAYAEFKNYRRNKACSYILLGGTAVFLAGWTITSANYMVKTDDYRINAFFKWRHLPLLGGYFACFYSSIYLNLRGDKNLKKAVRIYNNGL